MGITEMTTANVFTIVVTGILVVFLVLALLVFFVFIMGKLLHADQEKTASKTQEPKETVPAPQPEKKQAVNLVTDDNEDEVVAAITAAIACIFAEENSSEIKPFVIKSIKKAKQGRLAWNQAGIMDNTSQF